MNAVTGKSLFTDVFQKCLCCCCLVFYFQFKFHFSFVGVMNIIKGNPSSNDFAHYFEFYVPCKVKKFHSYQRIAVSRLGENKKHTTMGTLILCNWFQTKLLKLTFSPVHVRSRKLSDRHFI